MYISIYGHIDWVFKLTLFCFLILKVSLPVQQYKKIIILKKENQKIIFFTQLLYLKLALQFNFRQVLEKDKPDRKGNIHYSGPATQWLNIQIFTHEQIWQIFQELNPNEHVCPFHTAFKTIYIL